MDRYGIEAFFEEAAKVEQALGGLLHRDAAPALRSLQEMRDIVGEQLPGGYFGKCIGCEQIKGQDEVVECGDEYLCRKCAKEALTARQAAGA